MSKIKTREKVRDIKLLDKSAVAGQRMKNAFIRSKDHAANLMDDGQDSPGEYAGDKVQFAADNFAHDTVNAAASGTKTAVRRGRTALQKHQAKKTAEKPQEQPHSGEQRPATDRQTAEPLRRPQGQKNSNSISQQRRSDQPGVQPPGTAAHSDTDPIVERGRQFAKQQAEKRADTARRIQNRSIQANRPAIKTRDALSRSRQAEDAASQTAEAVKQSARTIRQTAKGTVKTTQRTVKTAQATSKSAVKTAERTSKTAIKTAEHTAKAAQKAAQASAKAAKVTAQAARAAAKTAAAAKATAKAVAATVKAIIAAVKALISAIAAGGWVAVLAIVIICLIGLLVGSCFGIFFSGEDSGTGQTMSMTVREINQEYEDKLEEIKTGNPHDVLEMSGSRAVWPEVLAVYAVKTTTDPDHGQEVASMDDEKKAILKEIFWAMNEISYSTSTSSHDVVTETDDGEGNIVETTTTVTETTLYITVSHKTADEMANEYGFNADQREQLAELLAEENRSLWSSALYGIGTGDGEIVTVALSQLGNIGGAPYWSWYGFGSRVEWCACFVSWCANECGYIDAGVIPKFAGCVTGAGWFKDRGLWQDNSYEPRPGDIIFFDWNNRGSSGPQDGEPDHVGIVEKVENGIVYTVEGNSGDSCRENHYAVGYYEILGYGVPAY